MRTYIEECVCGSELEAHLEYDARGIPLGFMCDECRASRLKKYRRAVLEDCGYECGEPIEPEDYTESLIAYLAGVFTFGWALAAMIWSVARVMMFASGMIK